MTSTGTVDLNHPMQVTLTPSGTTNNTVQTLTPNTGDLTVQITPSGLVDVTVDVHTCSGLDLHPPDWLDFTDICGDTSVTRRVAGKVDLLITDQQIHLGDSGGAASNYTSTFFLAKRPDSARLSITFLYPNSQGVSGPEIDGGAPRILVNGQQIGLSTADFPDNPACITSSQQREYICDVTIAISATGKLVAGQNSIQVMSEAAFGGDDDFVFTHLVVTVWYN